MEAELSAISAALTTQRPPRTGYGLQLQSRWFGHCTPWESKVGEAMCLPMRRRWSWNELRPRLSAVPTDNGAPTTVWTELWCKSRCKLTENEQERLNCCLNETVNTGGSAGYLSSLCRPKPESGLRQMHVYQDSLSEIKLVLIVIVGSTAGSLLLVYGVPSVLWEHVNSVLNRFFSAIGLTGQPFVFSWSWTTVFLIQFGIPLGALIQLTCYRRQPLVETVAGLAIAFPAALVVLRMLVPLCLRLCALTGLHTSTELASFVLSFLVYGTSLTVSSVAIRSLLKATILLLKIRGNRK